MSRCPGLEAVLTSKPNGEPPALTTGIMALEVALMLA